MAGLNDWTHASGLRIYHLWYCRRKDSCEGEKRQIFIHSRIWVPMRDMNMGICYRLPFLMCTFLHGIGVVASVTTCDTGNLWLTSATTGHVRTLYVALVRCTGMDSVLRFFNVCLIIPSCRSEPRWTGSCASTMCFFRGHCTWQITEHIENRPAPNYRFHWSIYCYTQPHRFDKLKS